MGGAKGEESGTKVCVEGDGNSLDSDLRVNSQQQ